MPFRSAVTHAVLLVVMLQLLLRCCLYSPSFCCYIAHAPNPGAPFPGPDRSLRSGGGPESVLAPVFQMLEGCAQTPDAGSKHQGPVTAALGCMLVGAVAEGIGLCDLQGGKWVLTASTWEQQRRLTSLCTLARPEGRGDAGSTRELGYQAAGPAAAAAALALALILELELSQGGERRGSFGGGSWGSGGQSGPLSSREEKGEGGPPLTELALSLLPTFPALLPRIQPPGADKPSATESTPGFGVCNGGWGEGWGGCGGAIAQWHGARDGYIGIVTVCLRLGGPDSAAIAVRVNLHHGLMSILEGASGGSAHSADAHQEGAVPDTIGVSPTGLMWLLAGLYMCLPGNPSVPIDA